jgi:hypothetical protein
MEQKYLLLLLLVTKLQSGTRKAFELRIMKSFDQSWAITSFPPIYLCTYMLSKLYEHDRTGTLQGWGCAGEKSAPSTVGVWLSHVI